jgi:nicotinate-nucleotide adenylyltransferase
MSDRGFYHGTALSFLEGVQNVGVLGGSFDPVHFGHLMLAEEAIKQAGLERVLFMPTKIQPFKQDVFVSPAEDRIAMLKLATEGDESFGVTSMETDAEGVSYTIFSLRKLRDAVSALSVIAPEFSCNREPEADSRPKSQIWFILGADMFMNLHKWYMSDELLTEFAFVCGLRAGTPRREVEDYAKTLTTKYGTKTVVLDNNLLEISSTEIRRLVRVGASAKGLLPEVVREYIEERRLYND